MSKNIEEKYKDYSRGELLKQIELLENRKQVGFVWEESKVREKFDNESVNKLPILKEIKELGVETDKNKVTNVLIEGDNYHSLSVLNYTHSKMIDVIYIDPPYNTGNRDFTFNDNYVDKDDPWRHSKWLSFMKKRLVLAENLLKESGTIFISIDDNEFAQLKLLCDEIFGENNFIIDVIWNSRKSVSNDAIISSNHNHTLLYAKNMNILRNDKSKFRLPTKEDKFSNIDNDKRGSWVADPFEAAGIRKNLSYGIKNPNTGEIFYPVKGRHWAVLEEEYFRLLKDNRIVFGKSGKGKPQRKRFLSGALEKGSTPKSIWDDVGTTTNGTQELEDIMGEKKFNNPKPVSLIRRILELATDKNSIVLDFMAGSGTTGHAVLAYNKEDGGNRKFILCTNNENEICAQICYPRIKKVINGYKNPKGEKVEGLGGNLKYFKTAFVDSEPTDKNKKKLVDESTEILCLKEDCFDKVASTKHYKLLKNYNNKWLGIIYDDEGIEPLKREIKKRAKRVSVYVFSLDDSAREEEFEEIIDLVDLKPIPAAILNVYKRIFKC